MKKQDAINLLKSLCNSASTIYWEQDQGIYNAEIIAKNQEELRNSVSEVFTAIVRRKPTDEEIKEICGSFI